MSIAIAGVVALGAMTVSAQVSEGEPKDEQKHAQHQQVREAVENNDYQTWAEIMADKEKFPAPVTQSTFDQLTAANTLREAGDHEGAKAIIEGLGLKKQHGKRRGHGPKDPEKREAVESALESGNYQAWVDAVGADSKRVENVTEANFDRLREAHALRESGDYESAKEIMQELGFKGLKGKRGPKGNCEGHGDHYEDEDDEEEDED